MPHCPSTMCIWDGCSELGTFDHIAWECPRRPCNILNIPKRAEFLSSRYGWVVTNQVCDIDAVHGWLVGSCARDALVPCPSMTCACLYHGPSYLPVHWSCSPLGLAWFVWVFAPLVSFLRCWLVFRWAVCTFGVVWAPWPPAMESFVPVAPVCRGVFCNTAIESANADKVRVNGIRVRAGSVSAK